ncbi:TetR/AcrR family transcriptional regulator [Amycolatopsis nigrescens]|uniref:TetR/AcrR family transcriptional regulator n=1 Tax=Amycolatopsis nigrescens TaxID=381445 RepID=UPI0003813E15|nr:TetR/AcrR family transcriptional regulator [Amycolatopsis nigrescens]
MNADGLRELRKRQTRQTISDLATRLFIERGFERVTIAEVAAAAGVAKMTVTNHFPRKEDLVLDVYRELVDGPARTVSARPPGQSALAALRESYLDGLARRDALLGFSGPEFARMLDESPILLARLREMHEDRERALAEVLAEETRDPGVTPRAVAAQLTAAHRVLFDEVLRRTLAGEEHDRIAAAVTDSARTVFALLAPSLSTYPPAP